MGKDAIGTLAKPQFDGIDEVAEYMSLVERFIDVVSDAHVVFISFRSQ